MRVQLLLEQLGRSRTGSESDRRSTELDGDYYRINYTGVLLCIDNTYTLLRFIDDFHTRFRFNVWFLPSLLSMLRDNDCFIILFLPETMSCRCRNEPLLLHVLPAPVNNFCTYIYLFITYL